VNPAAGLAAGMSRVALLNNWVRDEQSPQWPAPPVPVLPVASRGGCDASGSADTRTATC